MDFFEDLLHQLGKTFNLSLKPDAHHACVLILNKDVRVQLEMDRQAQHLVIGTDLGELPTGKFRELCLKATLKENNTPHPRNGTLAYSKQKNCIVLFDLFDTESLDGKILHDSLKRFANKAVIWRKAIQTGSFPESTLKSPPSTGSGMFGIRP